MKTYKPGVLGLLAAFSVISAAGCGDNIVTALNKVAAGQICQLTTGEIMILNQTAIDLGKQQTPPVTVPILTSAQAQALIDFAKLNGLCTIQDLENLPTQIQQGRQLEGLAALEAAFPGFSSTSVNPHALAALFHSTLGVGSGGQSKP